MRRRWTAIALVLVCSAVVQAAIIRRAALPALDSLRSVAAAEALIQTPTLATLAAEPEPPLFPIWLACVQSLRGAMSSGSPDWSTSLQLAAAAPLVAWPAGVYWLTRRRFGPWSALMAGLFAGVLPAAARLGGEGLPDALYLPLLTVTLVLLSVNRPSVFMQMAGGVLLALTMLIRVEAVLLLPTIGLAELLATRQELPVRWRSCRRRIAATCCGLAGVLLPWLWGMGSLTPGDAFIRLAARAPARDGWVYNAAPSAFTHQVEGALDDGDYAFDSKERGVTTRRYGASTALRETADELLVATGFVLPLLALGTALRIRRAQRWDRVALCGAALWAGLAFANSWATGYLSSRHVLPVAVFLLPAAAGALANVDLRVLKLPAPSVWRRGAVVSVIVAWGAWCWQPLHDDRSGHRQAGRWLAASAGRNDRVLDTWGWTALTSGRATYRYDAARTAFADPQLRYVVVERRELESGTPRAATLGSLLRRNATCVAEFDAPAAQSAVLLFHWRPPLAQNERLAERFAP